MDTVTAILDRPGPRSFGMLAMIVRDDAGRLRTEGLAEPQDHPVSEEVYRELLERGEAVRLDSEFELPHRESRQAVLWLGSEFESEAGDRSLPLPPHAALPELRSLEQGSFSVLQADHVYLILDVWLQRAARIAIDKNDHEVARLMSWALPDRDETRAALWSTAQDPAAEIDWLVRLERDRGMGSSVDSTTRRLEEVRRRVLGPRGVVYGFTGHAKCGDKEIADAVAKRQKITHLSFGSWLKDLAQEQGKQVDRRVLQELGEQTINAEGALSFCLSVMEMLPTSTRLSHEILSGSFIIEGVRHRAVLAAMRFLVGEDRLKLIASVRSEAERRWLLKNDEGITDAESVMSHSTEREIDEVAQEADLRLEPSLENIDSEAEKVLAIAGK